MKHPYFPYVIEVHAADHCNLNCKGCSHFAPLVPEEVFTESDSFRHDLARFKTLFERVYEIRIMGGEPLLNPDITSFFTTAREYYPKDPVVLYTNGTLLDQMPASFWQACADNDVSINISHYPINLPLESIRAKGRTFGIGINIPRPIKRFFKSINLKGDSDPKRSHRNCRLMFKTAHLREGRLYPCFFPAYVAFFNAHFAQDIPVTTEDFVDIHATDDPSRMIAVMQKEIPMCRYCLERRTTDAWEQSKRELDEWIGSEGSRIAQGINTLKQYPVYLYHEIKRRKC